VSQYKMNPVGVSVWMRRHAGWRAGRCISISDGISSETCLHPLTPCRSFVVKLDYSLCTAEQRPLNTFRCGSRAKARVFVKCSQQLRASRQLRGLVQALHFSIGWTFEDHVWEFGKQRAPAKLQVTLVCNASHVDQEDKQRNCSCTHFIVCCKRS